MSTQLNATIILGVDLPEAETKLREVEEKTVEAEKKTSRLTQGMVSNIRSVFQMTSLMIGTSGEAIDQTLLFTGEALLLTAESIITINTALAAATFGVGTAIKAGTQAGTALLLLVQVRAINTRRTELRQKTATLTAIARSATMVFT